MWGRLGLKAVAWARLSAAQASKNLRPALSFSDSSTPPGLGLSRGLEVIDTQITDIERGTGTEPMGE